MVLGLVGVSLPSLQDCPFFTSFIGIALLVILAVPPVRGIAMAKTKFWHSSNSLMLKTKTGHTSSFAELCKSLIPPCRLNPFLFNGHLQTIWTAFADTPAPVYYKRWTFENEDPTYAGQFSVDFVMAPYQESDSNLPPRTTYFTEHEFETMASPDNRPMLVLLHGLSGGSHELYLRQVVAPLLEDGSWEACVVNARGCAMTKITTSVLFNARATWDVRQTVDWLRKTFPNRPLFGIGFSLGANIITNVSINPVICLRVGTSAEPHSTSAKRGVAVPSKQQSRCRALGTFMLAVWHCNGLGSGGLYIRQPWQAV